ncbi:hypothetical protein KFZ58_03850 [Virgibacillus sp. NKC19-16]|uniref:hypothetical protein n=1 Tax=Virgibacillus salidurans TaxID=2831673 RepID=UPI001F41CEB2|nr:hypothetical protein [Virgibacillus sp. NKC19-16]UJL47080.1 hypothetical protein KFZ58_03850 [Virgibacillus sp. NKC19-16]
MKKIVLLFTVAMFFTLTTIGSINAQTELTNEEKEFVQTIVNDFEDSHSIDLEGYDFFDVKKTPSDKDNLTPDEKSLTNVYTDIVENQSFFGISPLMYIDKANNNGYVLEKELNGMNNLYILSKSNQTWKISDKVHKKGIDLDELLNK